jgi:hypothetical protein
MSFQYGCHQWCGRHFVELFCRSWLASHFSHHASQNTQSQQNFYAIRTQNFCKLIFYRNLYENFAEFESETFSFNQITCCLSPHRCQVPIFVFTIGAPQVTKLGTNNRCEGNLRLKSIYFCCPQSILTADNTVIGFQMCGATFDLSCSFKFLLTEFTMKF